MSDLFVEVTGSGEPVLLVMGLAMPGAAWYAMVPGLSARYRVATFDHRGVGRSGPGARTSIAALVQDTVGVLDHLGWARAHVVGVSMGGMIAQELALQHPERVRTLTLIATHAGGLFDKLLPLQGLLALLGSGSRARRLERLLHPPDRRVDLRAPSMPPARGALLAHLRAVRGHDSRARLARIAIPTLVMKPVRDVLVRPSGSDRLAAGIPGARLVAFPRAGHGLIAHDAERAVTELLAHLDAHPLETESAGR